MILALVEVVRNINNVVESKLKALYFIRAFIVLSSFKNW